MTNGRGCRDCVVYPGELDVLPGEADLRRDGRFLLHDPAPFQAMAKRQPLQVLSNDSILVLHEQNVTKCRASGSDLICSKLCRPVRNILDHVKLDTDAFNPKKQWFRS